jgi:DNA-binding NtrC family response regulator
MRGQQEDLVSAVNPGYVIVESEITDLVLAESRIEALRSLVLMFLREVDSFKKIVGPKRPRLRGEYVNLTNELAAFEISLIKDALIKCEGNQREAAKHLCIKTTTLHAKIKRYGIRLDKTVAYVNCQSLRDAIQ